MISCSKQIALFICLISTTSFVYAKEKTCVGHSDLPIVAVLQPPPCETCAETKAEIDELIALQATRTDDQAKRAMGDEERSPQRFLTGAGLAIDEEKMKTCDGFFRARREDEKAAISAVKSTFCRPRPYDTTFGEALKPLTHESSYAYPSGHATYGAVIGLILVEMLPEKTLELYHRIDDYAHSRMLVGVHHRSDIEAGKLLGAAIDSKLFAKDEFKQEFEKAKACVRAAVKLQ